MASLESLPADQRAVLQLLLKQGKSYDDLSALLRIEAGAVRDRARDAIDALGPDDDAVDHDRRDEIADYLLGQQTASQRAATREYLEGSASGRGWARSVAATLSPLAPDALPDIPAEPAEQAEAFEALEARTVRRQEVAKSSRTGGILVLAGLAVALAVALVLLISGGDDDDDDKASTPATSTAAAGSTTILRSAQLGPPEGRGGNAEGVVLILRQGKQTGLYIQGRGLEPTSDRAAYGIWLRASGRQQFLGYIQAAVGRDGTLQSIAGLTVPINGFREVLLTRESRENPKNPENIVLRGSLRTPTPEEQAALQGAAGGAGGTGTTPQGAGGAATTPQGTATTPGAGTGTTP